MPLAARDAAVHARNALPVAPAQARGPKKHLKRLNAPKHWMLDKLGGIWVRTRGPRAG